MELISIEQFKGMVDTKHLSDDEIMEIIKSLGALAELTLKIQDMEKNDRVTAITKRKRRG